MAKKKKQVKTEITIETIKLGFEPSKTVKFENVKYTLLANGHYLDNTTNKEVVLIM